MRYSDDQAICVDDVAFELSRCAENLEVPSELYLSLLGHFRTQLPLITFCPWIAPATNDHNIPLVTWATFFDHITVCGEKYKVLQSTGQASDSLVYVRILALGKT